MLDEVFGSLRNIDDRLETFVSGPVKAFGEQLAELFKLTPHPVVSERLKEVEEEIRDIKSKPGALQKPAIITDPKKKPEDPPAVKRLHELYGIHRDLVEEYLINEDIRAFKKNMVYLLERIQDLILKLNPPQRDHKIGYVDAALRQIEVVTTPDGGRTPVVEHVGGVSKQFADKELVESQPMLQSEFQLKMTEHSNGKRVGQIVKADNK